MKNESKIKITSTTPSETISEINEIEKMFLDATSEKQWGFLLLIQEDEGVELVLHRDYTELELIDPDKNELRIRMKETVGNHPDVGRLLNLLKVKHRFA